MGMSGIVNTNETSVQNNKQDREKRLIEKTVHLKESQIGYFVWKDLNHNDKQVVG